jgi:hypothetical protein
MVEFVSDRILHIIRRDRWCDIIILNVHAPTEEKIDEKDRFFDELERISDKNPQVTHKKCYEI